MVKKMAKNTICLWYDQDAEAAARFYAETFPDCSVGGVHRAPSDYLGGKAGNVLTVEFTVAGVPGIDHRPNRSVPPCRQVVSQPTFRASANSPAAARIEFSITHGELGV